MVALDGVLDAAIWINLEITVDDIGRALALDRAAKHIKRLISDVRLRNLAERRIRIGPFHQTCIAGKIAVRVEAPLRVIDQNVGHLSLRNGVKICAVLCPLDRGRLRIKEAERPVRRVKCALTSRNGLKLRRRGKFVRHKAALAAAKQRSKQRQRQKQRENPLFLHTPRLLS